MLSFFIFSLILILDGFGGYVVQVFTNMMVFGNQTGSLSLGKFVVQSVSRANQVEMFKPVDISGMYP